ncbi:sugar-binding domain-containing protein [Paenibacillus provencensis]|uniref:Sugar-binding domain-containing protein n=1 Tax=Paenibacillus provencensis TaxID=441151 RepID=A0ABW3PTZ2_9BACL|nr:sugar-binding domain-containing protein [Paenibacillus sp. MER 78]MCM3129517.1 beta-glucuronidase [Paenibacillus sp. MER 78]
MLHRMNLEGAWSLQLDEQKHGLQLPFEDSITLPNTTSHANKGKKNTEVKIGSLTDEYAFEGYAWFAREVEVPEELQDKPCFLFLERTRVTTVWVDGEEMGTQNSLNTPHVYDLTGTLSEGKHTITIRVDNTNYPTKGGHMTSEDTQTNWNGITGRVELQFYSQDYLENIQTYTDPVKKTVHITAHLNGRWDAAQLHISACSSNTDIKHTVKEQTFQLSSNNVSVTYEMGEEAQLWSDLKPNLYELKVELKAVSGEVLDSHNVLIGLREFRADGDKFTINGNKTFLRGKHDGLIFPLTGYAPTDVEEWLRIMTISKSYGINHYRFHTCCPPEAAFIAADMLGIYMEPELPFWGTITDETHEQHNQAEQDYLIREGYAMLREFGNHPSFVMMSLGNELWGSKERLNDILKQYKAYDSRHLYTEGSNNFQFVPVILEEDDFYCGVRFSKERLFRGSYAMCDAPLGHVQTDFPGTMKDYDEQIWPSAKLDDGDKESGNQSIQIQYGTEMRTVQAETAEEQLIPRIPVISHEIGQYATYPNFKEIEKYTGPLKAKNFEVFRTRLEAKGLGHLAEAYFENSGKLAVACYKEELEAAFRTKKLAGFQLLDLQDFSGQGTALVGVLDAFMDSKGLVTPEEWRTFCSDAVLLARFDRYNYEAGESFEADIQLSYYRTDSLNGKTLKWELINNEDVLVEGEMEVSVGQDLNYINIGSIHTQLPSVTSMTQVVLKLSIAGTDIYKNYDLWIYPVHQELDWTGTHLFRELNDQAKELLERGEDILLLPDPASLTHSIEGTYSTDFWCYPMFRSISESMNKPTPVGTMGLYIDNKHPVFESFPTETHSTYPWWSIVMNSRSIVLDDTVPKLQPIVQTIDNFERNHKLSLLFEARVLNGRVVVGTFDDKEIAHTPEGKQFLNSILQYVKSDDYHPQIQLQYDELARLL